MNTSESPSSTTTALSYYIPFIAIVYPLLTCGTLFGNILVVVATVRFKCLHTASATFITQLAVADLFTVILAIPSTVLLRALYLDMVICNILSSIALIPFTASTVFLIIIGVDRLLSIARPFLYARLATVKRSMMVSVLGWAGTLLLSFFWLMVTPFDKTLPCDLNTTERRHFGLFLVGLFYCMMAILTVLYSIIFFIAWKQSRIIWTQENNLQIQSNQNNAKIFKMMSTVLGLFYLCWLPLVIMYTVLNITGDRQEWVTHYMSAAGALCMSNSAINPIIYATGHAQFRGAFKMLLHIKLKQEDRDAISV